LALPPQKEIYDRIWEPYPCLTIDWTAVAFSAAEASLLESESDVFASS
jgi:hypothetical protein